MNDFLFPHLSASTFLRAPARQQASERPFAIAGIGYDGAASNRPGARFGPAAIRRASLMLYDATHSLFDGCPIDYLCDAGDLALPHTSLTRMRETLAPLAKELVSRHHMCWLGGDHSVTLPLLRAYRAVFDRPLGIVHFDAHCDAWSEQLGEPSGHGTWMYEALQEGLLDPKAVVQLGIRSSGGKEPIEYVTGLGGKVWTARQLRGLENPFQLAPVLDEIRHRIAAAGNPPTYLTLDIDCLDPAFAPGTGTPEPGGLTTAQVLTFLEELIDLPWVGMDCVEVSPPFDVAELTSNAASAMVWTYLAGRVHKHIHAR